MHLGNVFSASLAYASARKQGGEFIVRLEDADARCQNPLNSELLLEDLSWLGIEWDEEPVKQRNRRNHYQEAFEMLKTKAHVYPCFCSRADLHAASAPHASDGTPVYEGTCRGLSDEEVMQKTLAKSPALRIEVPDVSIDFEDAHLGPYSQSLARECGDFVLQRSDGCFAYQLAVVVDDALAGVTEVVRGDDLLSSTPRQIWLSSLLGTEHPVYAHHPVLYASDGKRLSKREKSLAMDVIRQEYAPEELLGRIAVLSGIVGKEEPLSMSEFIDAFNWESVGKAPVILETLV